MKWFEMIHLRSTEREIDQMMQTVERLIAEVKEQKNTQVINTYRSAGLDTDLSLLLCHDSDKVENDGSQLALCIAQTLKAFGMVKHSVWIEIPQG